MPDGEFVPVTDVSDAGVRHRDRRRERRNFVIEERADEVEQDVMESPSDRKLRSRERLKPPARYL